MHAWLEAPDDDDGGDDGDGGASPRCRRASTRSTAESAADTDDEDGEDFDFFWDKVKDHVDASTLVVSEEEAMPDDVPATLVLVDESPVKPSAARSSGEPVQNEHDGSMQPEDKGSIQHEDEGSIQNEDEGSIQNEDEGSQPHEAKAGRDVGRSAVSIEIADDDDEAGVPVTAGRPEAAGVPKGTAGNKAWEESGVCKCGQSPKECKCERLDNLRKQIAATKAQIAVRNLGMKPARAHGSQSCTVFIVILNLNLSMVTYDMCRSLFMRDWSIMCMHSGKRDSTQFPFTRYLA